MKKYDVIVLGAGAAGLYCSSQASKYGAKTLVLEKNKKIGLKIQISGGGRCNFTNLSVGGGDFLSENKHFCKSALAQFGSQDFIDLIQNYKIDFYEKKLGQLFCKKNSREIINMLLSECSKYGVKVQTETDVWSVRKEENHFFIKTSQGEFSSKKVVVATGGLSFKKLGASNIGFEIAKRFGLNLIERRPALVPLVKKGFSDLAGVSLPVQMKLKKRTIEDDLLFTHWGFSGPATLKISLFWEKGDQIKIDFLPQKNIEELLMEEKKKNPQKKIKNALSIYFPNSFVQKWLDHLIDKPLQEVSLQDIRELGLKIHCWNFIPEDTEGYEKAEVTKGGVCTSELSSKTLECKKIPGAYFIGEVVDVTGLLGGYNFQWAWSSGYVAGNHIAEELAQ